MSSVQCHNKTFPCNAPSVIQSYIKKESMKSMMTQLAQVSDFNRAIMV